MLSTSSRFSTRFGLVLGCLAALLSVAAPAVAQQRNNTNFQYKRGQLEERVHLLEKRLEALSHATVSGTQFSVSGPLTPDGDPAG